MRKRFTVSRRRFLFGVSMATSLALTRGSHAETAERPELMLAEIYSEDVDVTRYWVSEKYDGVRAFWDGHSLVSRAGNSIAAPAWFTNRLPRVALDGELWVGRGRFEELLSTVRDKLPDPTAWRSVRYLVFDAPRQPGPFSTRLATLRQTIATHSVIEIAAQWQVESHAALVRDLAQIVSAGGEGLMLKREAAPYLAGRTDNLLKLKPYRDADAQVVAHLPGQGKHAGRLGALEVRSSEGLQFRIGTGFTDEQRQDPPPVGSWVTYRFQGTTSKGIPRFASFLRQRE